MKKHISIFMLFLLAGCATMTPEQIAAKKAMEANAAKEIICLKGDDCDVKWGRAIDWIKKESKWKIKTQTDNLIQTLGLDSTDNRHPGFVVFKTPVGSERFRITMDTVCDCFENPLLFKASFNTFVLGEVK